MLSRDTTVHIGAVLSGLFVLVLADYLAIGLETGPGSVAVFLLFYGLVLGGAHLVLAIRGEDGLIPVEARWRYVAMLVVVLGAGAAIQYAGSSSIGSTDLELRTVGLAVIALAVVAYLVNESVAGYRASRPR
ncbi:hypothetical protein [Natrialba taiwanensis]|uniref:Uncharacterized protein n=1 Tax=Natrialba taiwanensis DSM 12281 TaxID=1230458 RepID=L9ZTP6_9EURY|nr:hypothetical protein [Natrialba taiwanensis]ELY89451.1 hypothetical protein C484_14200 [Natrialba taiwanensis DSM 12281]